MICRFYRPLKYLSLGNNCVLTDFLFYFVSNYLLLLVGYLNKITLKCIKVRCYSRFSPVPVHQMTVI